MRSLIGEGSSSLAAVALCALSGLACADTSNEADASVLRIPVAIEAASGPVLFQAELASTPEERSRGLMHRTQLGEREAMLFLFPSERPLSFWMKNTLIPLDMIFIKANRKVLGIVENAEPLSETSRFVEGTSQFVLEIRGGLAKTLGIDAGQSVVFEAAIPAR